jgi:pimeloyl-ACP methyl ester carboxylesterase
MDRCRLARSLALSLILAAIGGCGTARVYRSHLGVAGRRAETLATANVPAPMTAMVLERQGLSGPIPWVEPRRAADRLEATGSAYSDPDGPLALADLRAKQARKAEVFAPKRAPGLYLDAIEAVSITLAGLPPASDSDPRALPDPREQEARKVYNTAAEGFLRSSAGSWMKLDAKWRDGLAARGIRVVSGGGPAAWDPEQFDHFYFASDYKVVGIRDPKHADGLGVPLIAEHRAPPFVARQPKSPGEQGFYPAKIRAYPATALVRVGREAEGKSRVVTLELHDPMRFDAVPFDGGMRPLKYDLTTPLSFYFTRLPLPRITQVGLLRPGNLEGETGLYLLHPYEAGKIPVVLIHGLNSSPDTWHQALNELRGDPELRARYQFWVFFYPTGDPFLYAASKFRAALNDVRNTLDPGHSDPAFEQMVLVGHSMGGLIARLMVTESGNVFWDGIANRPFSELNAGDEQRRLLAETYFFHANPSIRRLIFIATPHRGSTLSVELIGRMTTALIQLPGVFLETQRDLRRDNPPDFFVNRRVTRPDTSITQLSPRSPAIASLNQRPLPEGLPHHSVIAQAIPGPVEQGSDLVVPYSSSHIDSALSELVVPGNHSCLGSPETIEEIRRILKLHLVEIGPAPARAFSTPVGEPGSLGGAR